MRPSLLSTTLFSILAIFCGLTLSVPADAVQTEYYFDYANGSDETDGTEAKPWKRLSKLEGLSLNPGDKVLFARGSSFHGGVTIASSGTKEAPIVLTSYGDDEHMPKFTNSDPRHLNGNVFLIKGSYTIVDGLYFHNGPAAARGLSSARKMGAVFIARGAEHNIIRNCEVYDYPVGFQSYGTHCLITKNYIHDCTGFLQYPGWGPVGIMVATSHHEISYNRIENYLATGGSWGSDGGAIEIDSDEFLREDFDIHHNISIGNEGFLEITRGDDVGDVRDVRVHHNISDDFQQFILFWGGQDCVVEHNTVLCRRPRNSNMHVVFLFTDLFTENIEIRNNIFAVANGLQVFKGEMPYQGNLDYDQPRQNNLYYSLDGSVEDPCGLPLGPGDAVGDPLFMDLEGMDLRLRPDSPAINTASDSSLPVDFDGKPRTFGRAPDKGAFEFHAPGNEHE